MMKKKLILGTVFLLSGCPGHQDPIVIEHPAQVAMKDNNVCISISEKDWEYITSVQLYSESGQRFFKTFSDPVTRPHVATGACLPIFGFNFMPQNTYSAYYSLGKKDAGKERTFAISFTTLRTSTGGLEITPK
ncbi:putative T6SS immunity periplasmic lipoprotein [Serratia entomophila]|uniref:putative T6SS immunity periplasmic lipoprotein n=1 Tax=Serratia entomophila TaxID=42906 RepID=UPI0021BB2CE2|nr:putative T6SS immunity periplasmic lipoprotein [Serratia entomophila]